MAPRRGRSPAPSRRCPVSLEIRSGAGPLPAKWPILRGPQGRWNILGRQSPPAARFWLAPKCFNPPSGAASAPRHLAGALQARKSVLAQGLVDAHGHGVAEVQAPGVGHHGQADAPVPVLLPERQGQAGGFLAEEQPAVRREAGGLIGPGRLGGGEPQVPLRLRMAAEEVVQALVVEDLHQVPVVQPGPADGLLRDVESQRPDQVQAAAGGGAGAGDVAAVLGDLRFHQHDIEHRSTAPFLLDTSKSYCTALAEQIQL